MRKTKNKSLRDIIQRFLASKKELWMHEENCEECGKMPVCEDYLWLLVNEQELCEEMEEALAKGGGE